MSRIIVGLRGCDESGSVALIAADCDDQYVDEIMIFGPIHTRISQIFKAFDETQLRMLLHPTLLKHTF